MNNELLHAYFDGALEPAQAAEVERALAEDPKLRAELDRIAQADEALALLPAVEVDDGFTARVLETAQVDGALDLLPGHTAAPEFADGVARAARRGRRRGVLLRIGAVAAVAAAALFSVSLLGTNTGNGAGGADAPVAEYRWEADTETFDSLDLTDLEDEILKELEVT